MKLHFISSVNKIRCNDLPGVSSSGSASFVRDNFVNLCFVISGLELELSGFMNHEISRNLTTFFVGDLVELAVGRGF